MTGRPEVLVRRNRVRFQGVGRSVRALAVALVLAGCADGTGEPAAAEEVAVCADLRARENELIRVANDVLSDLAQADGDAARAAALAEGYDRLLATLAAQEPADVPGQPELSARLVAGQESAVAGLRDERDRFVGEVRAVSQADEHGRAGELQTALEKVFSDLEPPRSAYVAAGLDDDVDADPGCRHVTQRADPAA